MSINIKAYLEYEKEYRRFTISDSITFSNFVQLLEMHLIPSYAITMHHYFIFYQNEKEEWTQLFCSEGNLHLMEHGWERVIHFAKEMNHNTLYITISGVSQVVFDAITKATAAHSKRHSNSRLRRCLHLHIDIPETKRKIEAKFIDTDSRPFTPS